MKRYCYFLRLLMESSLFIVIAIVLFSSIASASEWMKTFDGGFVLSIDSTSDGGLVVGTEVPVQDSSRDVLIKLSASGDEEWRTTFGDSIRIYDVHQTSDGGYIVAGDTGSDYVSGYVSKLDSSGAVQWENTLSGPGSDFTRALSVAETSDGGFIVAGDTSYYNNQGYYTSGLLIAKLDGQGQQQWLRRYDDYDSGYTIQQTSDGGYIVAGDKYRCHILKLDSSGNVEWSHSWFDDDSSCTIRQVADGGYIAAGSARDSSCFGDITFLAKLDSSGDVSWYKYYKTGSDGAFNSVEQTADGGYIVSGKAYPQGENYGDAIVLKFDSNGQIEWQKSYGSDADDNQAVAATQTTDGGYGIAVRNYNYDSNSLTSWILKTDSQGHVSDCACNETNTQYTDLGLNIPPNIKQCNNDFVIYWWEDNEDYSKVKPLVQMEINELYFLAFMGGIGIDSLNIEQSSDLTTYFHPWTEIPFDVIEENPGDPSATPRGYTAYFSDPRYAYTLSVKIDGDTATVTRLFGSVWGAESAHRLSVVREGEGSVSTQDGAVDCGDTCNGDYLPDAQVTLTATPSEGFSFAGWNGDCAACGNDPQCTITMDADKTCTANFEPVSNEPPVIDSFTAEPTSGDAPLDVTFTCEAHDNDGQVVEYCFDFDGDGEIDQCDDSTNTATFTYNDPGTYHPTCTVKDDDGESVTSEPQEITVNEAAPSWVDITDTLNITHSTRQLYDRIHRCFFIQVTVANPGEEAISGPVRLVITNPSIPVKTGVGVGLDPDGYTEDGDPYFIIVPEEGSLDAGGVLRNLRINFDLQRRRLTYGIKVEQLTAE